jgi:cell division protein FtsZ
VNDPAMHGELRVTVIATGFDKPAPAETGRPAAPGVLPFRERGVATGTNRPTPAPPAGHGKPVEVSGKRPAVPPPGADVNELEIPTFIRRQMD